MSDKAFKVTAGAIGALAMAVVVRSLVTPSTVEVQTGARVVCSQCGKTISESITTVEVRESEAASRKVTETVTTHLVATGAGGGAGGECLG